jgi:hypothetical protein
MLNRTLCCADEAIVPRRARRHNPSSVVPRNPEAGEFAGPGRAVDRAATAPHQCRPTFSISRRYSSLAFSSRS